MSNLSVRPRILFVTPDVVFIPGNTEEKSNCKKPLQPGFAAFMTDFISDLFESGADVHVAQPDYRKIFTALLWDKREMTGCRIPSNRIHLAEDRKFFYSNFIGSNNQRENRDIAIIFQREASYQIVPRVQPDLIHCHGWMTGLIPAMARHWKIPCLYTLQNTRSAKSTLSQIEDKGIDGAAIWQQLYFERYPGSYKESRDTNPFDFLLSGILSACHVNTADPVLLSDILRGQNELFDIHLMQALTRKYNAGCAGEVFNLADPDCKTAGSKKLHCYTDPNAHYAKKQKSNRIKGRQTCSFNYQGTAQRYINLYEHMLQRPLIDPGQQICNKP